MTRSSSPFARRDWPDLEELAGKAEQHTKKDRRSYRLDGEQRYVARGIAHWLVITTGSEIHSALNEGTVQRCFVGKTAGNIIVFEVAPA